MKYIVFTALFLNLISALSVAQTNTFNIELKWESEPEKVQVFGNTEMYVWSFENCGFHPIWPGLPIYSSRLSWEPGFTANMDIVNPVYTEIDLSLSPFKDSIPQKMDTWVSIELDRRSSFLSFGILPIYRNGSKFYRLEKATIILTPVRDQSITSRTSGFKSNSVLRDGDFYKMGLFQSGIYRLGFDDLNALGLNPANIDPRNIKIFSRGGGMVPEANASNRIDDLEELTIFVSGQSDGRFDREDYILFYAEGPDELRINREDNRITQIKNIYSRQSFAFITASGGAGKRIEIRENNSPGIYVTNTFNDYIRYEEDRVNIGEVSQFTSGGGKNWYGDLFRNLRERNYSSFFSFPGIDPQSNSRVRAGFIARSPVSSRFFLDVGGQSLQSPLISAVGLGNAEGNYANEGVIEANINIATSNPSVIIRYPDISNQFSEGWLDFIEIQCRRNLSFTGTQLLFRDFNSFGQPSVTYTLQTNASFKAWEVTNHLNPIERSTTITGNLAQLNIEGGNLLRQFILFTDNNNLPKPELIGKIPNQNLHALNRLDLLIIYHKDFESESARLANHRRNFNNFTVEEVAIDQIYNEFSGGAVDVAGIRDFIRMLYERDARFRYVLLFGDASFDYRNILARDNFSNFIPTWYTPNSLNPVNTFPSDDFYALLDPNEGGNLVGAIDIAIGRLPASNLQQARTMVDKIIDYETNSNTYGDWRLRLTFSADDDDSNRHINDSEAIAAENASKYPVFNQEKIYLDAFPLVITPGGARFPAAREALNRSMFRGALIYNYLGHGGATGLAQERVMTVEDITSWTNREALPLFVTATCTFTPFDDPNRISAGEHTIFSSRGGSIGLMTTTRAVFASSNRRLTQSVFNTIFEKVNGEYPLIGEVMRLAKNATSEDTLRDNARKFLLIGDPTLKLAIPKYKVVTTTINGRAVGGAFLDTLSATGKYTITGKVVDENGNTINNFNGTVNPTIFDKPVILRTLGQSRGSFARDFTLQRNILFRGSASVVNGEFTFTFILPKDINYDFGRGKISYYAFDGVNTDAAGHDFDIIIGGSANNENLSNIPPAAQLFMNSEDFAFGGITDRNPILLARLEAPNGINFTGNSVGHDLTAVLNDDDRNTIILNDFYESDLDDFTKGRIRYPLFNLNPGLNTIKLTMWDVLNQSAEAYVEFTVIDNENFTIKNLLNYPNPFNRHTSIQFEHNNSFSPMDIQVLIYTVSGKLVKSMERRIFPTDFAVRDIDWDGMDEYGQKLANGVYLYKVKVSLESPDGSRSIKESDFQKMVILN
jgi:hypothetical protein